MADNKPDTAPYGTWKSPITANLIAGTTISLGSLAIENDAFYWLEGRPAEGGRTVIVRQSDGKSEDVTPAGFNVRSRVHEYGGGAALVADGEVYFVNFDTQRIYCQRPGDAPRAVTPEAGGQFADMQLDRRRKRLICVREDHSGTGEPRNELVAVNLEGRAIEVLDGGHDFISSPRLDAAGERLAWLTWDHPNMPWDGTTLWMAEIDPAGGLGTRQKIAGGPGESIFQPEWSADGELIFVSDRSNWWNLYKTSSQGILPVSPADAEFGLPQWAFGMSTYGVVGDGRIIASRCQAGVWQLGAITDDRFDAFDLPYSDISGVRVSGDTVLFVGASPTLAPQLVHLDIGTGAHSVVRYSSVVDLDADFISQPESIAFPTADGATAYGFYYAPANRNYAAPADELPPLIVRGHGGPTGAASAALNLSIQFWTSRGFAVLDVNYRGSTGFGRAYREALYGNWGIADVDDMVAGAEFLVARDDADPKRLMIRGGSAGGFTTLAALTFRDTFSAGASHYGIGDLMALARDTHKFESRYLDRIVGPLPKSEALYRERSPINYTDQLDCPVIFLQGLDDKVVPPNQAEAMVDALKAKGIPVAYLAFEGEGHGFRKAENVERALVGELTFYGRVFQFEPADKVPPLEIHNLA
ncbi:MAG: prolyl oligopeptidase family serine peptidase [Alphaproteobacteria bacterium]|nr:prolyl oligopeptidase family serine peptidase [Alphaproteobacteria bacterium]